MANTRGMLVLGGALLIGGVAARGASSWIDSQVEERVKAQAGDTRPRVPMLVVTHDLAISSRLGPEDVAVVQMPEEAIPPEVLHEADSAVGRLTRVKLWSGEAVLEAKLAPKGAKGGLQAVIPDGFRAMTIKVNDVIGVAGFVLPGARVDVVAVIKQGQGNNPVSKVVLQNVEVLAVDQVVDVVDDKPKPSSAITLVVTPSDSERLALSVNQGEIQLVMRAFADSALVATPGVDAAAIISRPVAGVREQPSQVEVIENDRRSRTSVGKASANAAGETGKNDDKNEKVR